MFFVDSFLIFFFAILYLVRTVSKLSDKITAIESALNGAKIKRIELEVIPKE